MTCPRLPAQHDRPEPAGRSSAARSTATTARCKVAGTAPYAGEYAVAAAAYGVMVGAGDRRGRIVAVDATEAARAPGVLLVMTPPERAGPGRHVGRYEFPTPFARFRSPAVPERRPRPLLRPAGRARRRRQLRERARRRRAGEGDLRGGAAARPPSARDAEAYTPPTDRTIARPKPASAISRTPSPTRRSRSTTYDDADPEPLPDGAVRHHGLVGRRGHDGLHLGPDDVDCRGPGRRDAADPRRTTCT